MQEQIKLALASAQKGQLPEVIDALAGITGNERIDAALFAAGRGNAEETIEHLTAVLTVPEKSAEPEPSAPKRSFGRVQ